jgi:hypothetical protein
MERREHCRATGGVVHQRLTATVAQAQIDVRARTPTLGFTESSN